MQTQSCVIINLRFYPLCLQRLCNLSRLFEKVQTHKLGILWQAARNCRRSSAKAIDLTPALRRLGEHFEHMVPGDAIGAGNDCRQILGIGWESWETMIDASCLNSELIV